MKIQLLIIFFLYFPLMLYSINIADISNVRITTEGGNINVHADIKVIGMQAKQINVIAFFYGPNKQPMPGKKEGYKSTDNTACASKSLTPEAQMSFYTNLLISMPKDALTYNDLYNDYFVKVYVYSVSDRSFIGSTKSYTNFKYSHPISKRPQQPQGIVQKKTEEISNSRKKTARINKDNEEYDKRVENPDGTVTILSKRKCVICDGKKICKNCTGVGFVCYGPGDIDKCPACLGIQKCRYCSGNGYTINSITVNRNTKYPNYNNYPYNKINSSSDNSNNAPSYITCTSCGGTGLMNDILHDQQLRSLGAKRHYCQQCGREHESSSHESCSNCLGTGKKAIYP